jgi:hypothetical protein
LLDIDEVAKRVIGAAVRIASRMEGSNS